MPQWVDSRTLYGKKWGACVENDEHEDRHGGRENEDDKGDQVEDMRAPVAIDAVHRTTLERLDLLERWRIGIDLRVKDIDAHLGRQDVHAEQTFSKVADHFGEINQKLNLLLTERDGQRRTKQIIGEISKWAWRVIAAIAFVGWTVGTFFWDHWPAGKPR
jgi:hypothetical protein